MLRATAIVTLAEECCRRRVLRHGDGYTLHNLPPFGEVRHTLHVSLIVEANVGNGILQKSRLPVTSFCFVSRSMIKMPSSIRVMQMLLALLVRDPTEHMICDMCCFPDPCTIISPHPCRLYIQHPPNALGSLLAPRSLSLELYFGNYV